VSRNAEGKVLLSFHHLLYEYERSFFNSDNTEFSLEISLRAINYDGISATNSLQ
jgi:hypothetical protein